MSHHFLFSQAADGSDNPVCLNRLAPVRGLKFSRGLPGGPLNASWSLYAGSHFQHRGLNPGRRLWIIGGGGNRAWYGTLTAPARGDVWACGAVGIGAEANRYQANPATTGNINDLGDILTHAVTRGLPWTLPASLPVGDGDPNSTDTMPSSDLSGPLETVTKNLGKTWWLDNWASLSIDFPLTAPNYLFCPRDPGGGRTLTDGYVSAYLVTYLSSATGRPTRLWVRNVDAEAKFGVVEQPLDLTQRGAMTSTQATSAGNLQLGLHGPRAPFSGQFTLARGQILSIGGVPVDPASVMPPATGRLIVADPDRAGELYLSNATDIVVQQVEYDDDLDVLTITPWDTGNGGGLMGALVSGASGGSDAPIAVGFRGPAVVASHSGTQTATSGNVLVLAFDTDNENSYGTAMHNPASANDTFTCPTDGVYAGECSVASDGTTSFRQLWVFSTADGALHTDSRNAVSATTTKSTLSWAWPCHAGDQISYRFQQNSGANVNVSGQKASVRYVRPLT